MMAVGRIIAGAFIMSTVLSLATIYVYGSSWYEYFWVASSLRGNLNLVLDNFSVTLPSSYNGTLTVESQISVKNLSPFTISLGSMFQGVYLQAFTSTDSIAYVVSSKNIRLPVASETRIPLTIRAPIGQHAALFAAANSSNYWLWITWITLQLQASSGTYVMCYLGSNTMAPNTTSTQVPLAASGCQGPSSAGGGPGGG